MDARSKLFFEVQGQNPFTIPTFLSTFCPKLYYLSCLSAYRKPSLDFCATAEAPVLSHFYMASGGAKTGFVDLVKLHSPHPRQK